MSDGIYANMTTEDLDILDEMINGRIRSTVSVANTYIENHRHWLAIFAKYLSNSDKRLHIFSTRYYYKQDHLDTHFPTNPEATRICAPFDVSGAAAELEIIYIDTSTGAKIYDYASALCKANVGYIDRQSLAVPLTRDKSHKVKIVHLNNTVWILSNQIDDKFVEQSLALFPYLFAIQELQSDENVIGCCKAVTKQEPIKDFFKTAFDDIAGVRQQKKIDIIKTALNARVMEAISKTERDIRNTESYIKDYEEQLAKYHEKLENYQAQKLGYESKQRVSNEAVSDVLDFVDRNRFIQNLSLIKGSNGYSDPVNMLQLNILAPITIYEAEPLERQINNRLEDYDNYSMKAKVLKAFRRIFVEEELQMICQTYVRLDIARCNLDATMDSNRKSTSDYIRMCQPHLTRYNCWGDNKYPITEALRESDLIGALNNIIIATQNINFTDSTVLSSWIEIISNSSHLYSLPTCLSKADGRLWSIKEIVEQIEREETAAIKEQVTKVATAEEDDNEEVGHPDLTDEVPF